MPAAYSIDLRKRVVDAVVAGATVRQVAERFGVSVSSVVKWRLRARATGSPAPKPMGGKRHDRLAGERIWILTRIVDKPDLTLRELVGELERIRGLRVARDTLWRMLSQENLTFKKNADCPGAIATRREAAQRALDQALSAYPP